MAEAEDQIIFDIGGRKMTRTVPEGEGDAVLREILESGARWIEVARNMHVNRDKIISIEIRRASDPPRSYTSPHSAT